MAAVNIHEYLLTGQENAKTAESLAKLLRVPLRCISLSVEQERRAGYAICASCADPKGFYLASDRAELQAYISSLSHREREVAKTKRAMMQQLHRFNGEKTEGAAE